MELRFAPLYSGSSGNAVYIGCDDVHLLIDAGLPGSKIVQGLNEVGVDPGQLTGILVTHEHVDHIRGVGVLSRKYDLPVYATPGTWAGMMGKIGNVAAKNVRMVDREVNFFLGPMEIMAFPTPHDAAEPVGYAFELEASRFALATDVGCVKDSWFKYVEGSDAVLLESNYDPDMLKAGPYPYDLKKRILSKKGHLSNDDAGSAAAKLIHAGAKQIVLGHLSKENNFPELALRSAEITLMAEGIEMGQDADVRVALRDNVTGIFSVKSRLDHI